MKKITLLLLSMVAMFTMTSCSPMIYSDYVVEAYGTPYYSGGVLVYYQYQNMYYYPHYYANGSRCLKAYRKPLPPSHIQRPSHVRPTRPTQFSSPNRGGMAPRPNGTRRPTTTTRPNTRSTPPSRNVTRFGGRR